VSEHLEALQWVADGARVLCIPVGTRTKAHFFKKMAVFFTSNYNSAFMKEEKIVLLFQTIQYYTYNLVPPVLLSSYRNNQQDATV